MGYWEQIGVDNRRARAARPRPSWRGRPSLALVAAICFAATICALWMFGALRLARALIGG